MKLPAPQSNLSKSNTCSISEKDLTLRQMRDLPSAPLFACLNVRAFANDPWISVSISIAFLWISGRWSHIYIYCCFFAASRNNVHTRDTGRRMYLTDTVLGYTPIAFHLILFHLRLRDADDDDAPGWTLRCRNHSCRTFLWVSYSWKTTVGWNECHPPSGYYKLLFVCFDVQLIGKCNFCLAETNKFVYQSSGWVRFSSMQ